VSKNAWACGFGAALAEMHRRLLNGNDSTGVCEVSRQAGLALGDYRRAGLSAYDLRELRKAGVPEERTPHPTAGTGEAPDPTPGRVG
jgi:hypothetical protein